VVRVKSITLRITKQEHALLKRVKAVGFSTLAEVIRCAALSLATSDPKNRKAA
jgi:DNA-binding Xre family transcriptional regulator